METKTGLPTKLEAVLARLCEDLGPITKTKAVKLPYLVDVVAQHTLGRRITEGTHQTWDYGVVTRELFIFITHRSGKPLFSFEPHRFSESGVQIELHGTNTTCLHEEEEAVVDAVAEVYGQMDAARLGLLTKSLNIELDESDWGSNREAAVDEDAYARLSESWQALCSRMPNFDLSDRKNWGEPINGRKDYLLSAVDA